MNLKNGPFFHWKKDFLPNKDEFFSDLKVWTILSSVIVKYPHFLRPVFCKKTAGILKLVDGIDVPSFKP